MPFVKKSFRHLPEASLRIGKRLPAHLVFHGETSAAPSSPFTGKPPSQLVAYLCRRGYALAEKRFGDSLTNRYPTTAPLCFAVLQPSQTAALPTWMEPAFVEKRLGDLLARH